MTPIRHCIRFVLVTTVLYSIIVFIQHYKMSTKLISVNFKVYGKVQGVFFRKFTKSQAEQLGVFGWVMNETDGTVIGIIQGEESKIKLMKNWLSKEGSPYGRVEYCEFTDERSLDKLEVDSFKIIK